MKNHYPLIFSWKNSRITKKIIYFAFEFVNLRMKKVFLWIGIVLLSPILLFVILTVLLYCPPVQNWAVQRVVAVASEKLGADVSVGYVCLKFPLDLSLEHFVMVQHADTVADIGRLVVDVQLRPLFDNKVIVNELEIDHAKVNTSDFIAAARVKGRLQHLYVSSRGIDLDRQTVEVNGARIDGADVDVALSDSVPPDTSTTNPLWTISIDSVVVARSSVLVHIPGDSIKIGASMGRLSVCNALIDLGSENYSVGSIRWQDGSLFDVSNVYIGIDSVLFDSQSGRLSVSRLAARTPDSNVDAELMLDLTAFDSISPGQLSARLKADIGRYDIMRFAEVIPQDVVRLLPDAPVSLNATLNGNMEHASIDSLFIDVPSLVKLTMNGNAYNLNDMKSVHGELDLTADTYGHGRLTGRGSVDMSSEKYDADLKLTALDVHHLLRDVPLYSITSDVRLKGRGFDLMSRQTVMEADATVPHVRYDGYNMSGLSLKAQLRGGHAVADISSRNSVFNGDVSIDALVDRRRLRGTVVADIANADLYRLKVMDDTMNVSLCGYFDIDSDMKHSHSVQGTVNDLTLRGAQQTVRPTDVVLNIVSRRDTTVANIDTGNLSIDLAAAGDYERLISCCQRLAAEANRQLTARVIDQPKLFGMLPDMKLDIVSGNDNPLAALFNANGIKYKEFSLQLRTSSESGINGNGYIHSVDYQHNKLDTIAFIINTTDSMKVRFHALVENNKRNPQFVFRSELDGYLYANDAEVNIVYFDSEGKRGLDMGATAELRSDGINFRLQPRRPLIGYKWFTLNDDNYIFLGADNKVSANVNLIGDDRSGVKIYSAHQDSTALQDITVSLYKFDIGKVTSVIPYALPQVEGILNGDYHIVQNAEGRLSIASDMSITDMAYEHSPIGNISSEFIYMQREGDAHWVEAHIMKDDAEIGLLKGTYHAAGDSLDAVFEMNRFPLSVVNGFITDHVAGLEGYGEGSLAVRGPVGQPLVDGEIYLDSARIVSVPYGLSLRLDNDPVRIVGSRLMLENFNIYAYNDNPLGIMGSLDFSNLDKIRCDLRFRARDFMLINAKENPSSIAYGKAFVDIFGSVSGLSDDLRVRGRLSVLGKTDMSYVLRDSPLSTDNHLDELVRFVDFADTVKVAEIERPAIAGLSVDLTVYVANGTHIMAYLNANHSNYADLTGGGTLRLRYNNMDALQLTGRYTLNNGEMKYELPAIPLKTFTIQDGSYIEFTGDVSNPRLNITATERTKATVSDENGISRSVVFDCGVVITKTVRDMGLAFTLDAPEDMELSGELKTMGADQRSKLAVSMLTTGMYLADGNTSSFSMNNALSSFLNSQINSITGSALRTLDLSFGMDQTTDLTGSTHTDYSFKFAKRFWNNRFKVAVGGKVSSGAATMQEGYNKSFFDNVSLEYRLGDNANKYLSVFYKNNVYDWLEGYTQEYGGGFIWKRTMQNFWDIFRKEQRMPVRQTDKKRTTDKTD